MSDQSGRGLLALRDRAYAFVAARGLVSEEAVLAHVYGGIPPAALCVRLAAPLLEDARLERSAEGGWRTVSRQPPRERRELDELGLTTLALAASGPNPERGRVVRLCALHVRGGTTIERFTTTLNPSKRVPAYVTQRLGLAPEALDELPPFASILDDLVRFLDTRPVFAQDARLTWAFVSAEARRVGRVLAEPLLLDANETATRLLHLKGKPTLALVAAHLGIGSVRITQPEEEARVLGLVTARLLALADQQGLSGLETLLPSQAELDGDSGVCQPAALRRGLTARSQPDEPGVYVLRDVEQAALYVGKASRLRSRLEAYVHRPLGATRRLEGLVGSVEVVDSTVCATDLEALVLEARQIQRLQPRYNTVRRQRPPRLWIRLPPVPEPRASKPQPAGRRLEPSLGPGSADGEFVGPFRNETLAQRARLLARGVFQLDALRRGDQSVYEQTLQLAWRFLQVGGQFEAAETCARRHSTRLLQQVLAFDPAAMLLPADPRGTRYAVVRPGPAGIEGFVLDRGVLQAWSAVRDGDVRQFATDLLGVQAPRTGPDDTHVVVRWLGAQRPPAILLHLPLEHPHSGLDAADAIEAAALSLSDLLPQPGSAYVEDSRHALSCPAPGSIELT
ncbi:MAG: GIY-YIG nuclease family protein [Chloroflexota bacterium]